MNVLESTCFAMRRLEIDLSHDFSNLPLGWSRPQGFLSSNFLIIGHLHESYRTNLNCLLFISYLHHMN
jgi:hypothetical protein